jgi:hypothetical protein
LFIFLEPLWLILNIYFTLCSGNIEIKARIRDFILIWLPKGSWNWHKNDQMRQFPLIHVHTSYRRFLQNKEDDDNLVKNKKTKTKKKNHPIILSISFPLTKSAKDFLDTVLTPPPRPIVWHRRRKGYPCMIYHNDCKILVWW